MNYTVVTTKLDPQTKHEAQKTADELGIPLSILIKGFLKQLIRTRTVTFSANIDETPNAYLQNVMKQAEEDLRTGNASPKFTNIEDEIRWLREQGI